MSGRTGYVYVMWLTLPRDGAVLVKIGFSRNPVGRLAGLRRLPGFQRLELDFYWPSADMAAEERNIHEFYAPERVYSELFELSSAQLIDLSAYARTRGEIRVYA